LTRKPKKKKLSFRRIERKLDVILEKDTVVSSCEILSEKLVAERDLELIVISMEILLSVHSMEIVPSVGTRNDVTKGGLHQRLLNRLFVNWRLTLTDD
jgi:hypothetical protein